MKYLSVVLLLMLTLLGTLTGCKSGQISDQEIQIQPHSPVTETTVAEQITSAQEMAHSVEDSYQTLLTMMEEENVSEKGIKKAQQVIDKYGEQILSLSTKDYTKMTSEQLSKELLLLSDLLTLLREAKDAL